MIHVTNWAVIQEPQNQTPTSTKRIIQHLNFLTRKSIINFFYLSFHFFEKTKNSSKKTLHQRKNTISNSVSIPCQKIRASRPCPYIFIPNSEIPNSEFRINSKNNCYKYTRYSYDIGWRWGLLRGCFRCDNGIKGLFFILSKIALEVILKNSYTSLWVFCCDIFCCDTSPFFFLWWYFVRKIVVAI